MAVAKDVSITTGNSADGLNQQVSSATSITHTGLTLGGSATLISASLTFATSGTLPSAVSMTWNSVTMAPGPFISAGIGSTALSFIFYLVNPATGNHNLVANWTGSNDCYMSGISWTGTDTTTGINVTDNTTASATTTITVPSDTSGATFAVFSADGSTPTVNFNKVYAEAALGPGGGSTYQLGGTSNAHTFTGAGGTTQALAGIHIIAGGGGGATSWGPMLSDQLNRIVQYTG